AVGEAHLSDLAQRRVRLLRGRRVDARAHAALLRRVLERRRGIARLQRLTRLGNQLIDRRHSPSLPCCGLFARGQLSQTQNEIAPPPTAAGRSPVRNGHAAVKPRSRPPEI